MGIPIVVRPVDVDELRRAGEEPDAYLGRIVEDKATAANALMAEHRAAALLVADTIVIHGGAIMGKPHDDDASAAMITRLAGDVHIVATRYALRTREGREVVQTARTEVWFRELGSAQIERYVATGEGRDKAGAYGVQGIGAMLVERIDGDYANVVGLPICAVVRAMERLELVTACPITI